MVATGLWLAVTVVCTSMVWAATSIVAADVTDRPASVLAHQDVVSELASGPSAGTATPTSTAAKPGAPTSTVPSRARAPLPANPPAPTTAAPAEAAQPGPPVAPASPPTSATPPPTVRPASPSTTLPARQPTGTYSTSGGVVRVACNGVFIDLISAIPANGYAVNVVAGGPANVDVHFVGSGQDQSVKAVCFGQPIRYYDQMPPPRGS